MYDLTQNIDSESHGLNYILPGIQENLLLGKKDGEYPIRYDVSKNGIGFLEFSFINAEGLSFIHTEFEPSSRPDDGPDALKKKAQNQMKRVKHICTKIISEEQFKFNVTTFKEFAEKVISLIGDNYKDKLFRCKIVYNNRNYTTFPNYVPFIELMSEVPTDKSRLTISNDDKVSKSEIHNDMPVPSSKNPFESLPVDEPQTNMNLTMADPNQSPF